MILAIVIILCLAALGLLWWAQTVIEVEAQSFRIGGVE